MQIVKMRTALTNFSTDLLSIHFKWRAGVVAKSFYLQLSLIKPHIQFSRIRLSDHHPPVAFIAWVHGPVIGGM